MTLMVLSSIVFAYDVEYCKSIAGIAENIMKGRQIGISMVAMFDINKDIADRFTENSEQSDVMLKLLNEITISAYEEPRYHTESVKQEVIDEFSNRWFKICIKSSD